jgi:acetyl-CoA carboxylase biotin carboxyl carrier protein
MAEFDIDGDLVRKLAALLDETGLTEIEFADGERRIRVSKTVQAVAAAPQAAAHFAPGAAGEDASGGDEPASLADHPGAVTAPMVGTAYIAPEPGADPFVAVGDAVSAGQTLLLIEAMKTFNPVRAPKAGRVAQILISDATPVEFGEPLIILE